MSDTYKYGTDLVEDVDEPDADTIAAAQHAVCHYATGKDDAARLLSMLGIGPDTIPMCRECELPINHRTTLGRTSGAGADGVCRPCINRAARKARKAAQ